MLTGRRLLKQTAASLIIVLLAGLVLPAFAQSAVNYGPWPGFDGELQRGYTPFNQKNVSELTTFQCSLKGGEPFTDSQKEIFANIVDSSTLIFANQASPTDFKDGNLQMDDDDPNNKPYEDEDNRNVGYNPGTSGMQSWLRQQINLLRGVGTPSGKPEWAKMGNIRVGVPSSFDDGPLWTAGPDSEGRTYGFSIDRDDEDKDRSASDQRVVAQYLNANARFPHELTSKLPPGCEINPFAPPNDPSINDLFDNFGGTIIDLIFWGPEKFISESYDTISEAAWRFTFTTGHYERGDAFLGWATSCDALSNADATKEERAQAADSCSGKTPLGFSKANVKDKGADSWYMRVSGFLTWLISGFYFMILFAATAVFVVRGSRSGHFNVLKMIPRLILSIILTIFAPWIIGSLISFSNLLVKMLFSANMTDTMATLNVLLSQSGTILSGGEFFQRVFSAIVAAVTLFFLAMFIIYSVIRHALVIILLIIAPLAIFCIINQAWMPNFRKWLKALLAAIFIPVVLAFVFMLSMSINPLVMSPGTSYGEIGGIFGVLMIVATLGAMMKILKSTKDFALGQSSTAVGAMSGAGSALQSSSSSRGGLIGGIGGMGGGLLAGAGRDAGAAGGRSLSSPGDGGPQLPSGGGPPLGGGGIGGAGAGGFSNDFMKPGYKDGTQTGSVAAFFKDRAVRKRAEKGHFEIGRDEFERALAMQRGAVAQGKDPLQELGYTVYEKNGRFYKNFANDSDYQEVIQNGEAGQEVAAAQAAKKEAKNNVNADSSKFRKGMNIAKQLGSQARTARKMTSLNPVTRYQGMKAMREQGQKIVEQYGAQFAANFASSGGEVYTAAARTGVSALRQSLRSGNLPGHGEHMSGADRGGSAASNRAWGKVTDVAQQFGSRFKPAG